MLRQRNCDTDLTERALVDIEPLSPEPTWVDQVRNGNAGLVPRSGRSPSKIAFRAELGARDVIVAPFRSEDQVIGAILVANRLGEVSTFDTQDRRLFEALANHASVAFENSRLVQQLQGKPTNVATTLSMTRSLGYPIGPCSRSESTLSPRKYRHGRRGHAHGLGTI